MSFKREKDESRNDTETSTFSVKLKRNRWAKITNVYVPKDEIAPTGIVQLDHSRRLERTLRDVGRDPEAIPKRRKD